MSPQALVAELQRKPFCPFRIVMTDGRAYGITERDIPMVLVGQDIALVGFRAVETDRFFDRYEAASLAQIVRLEPLPMP